MMSEIVEDFEYVTVYDCGEYYCIESKPVKDLPVVKKGYLSECKLKRCKRCGAVTIWETEQCRNKIIERTESGRIVEVECGSREFEPFFIDDEGYPVEAEVDPRIYYEAVDTPRGRTMARTYYRKDLYPLHEVIRIARNLNKVWGKRLKREEVSGIWSF